MSLLRKSIAELIGTFVLVFCACGVAGLTGGSLVPTALTFGLVIIAMAYSIGRISGCHINPAVSIGCLIAKKMTAKEFLFYVVAQIIGGLLGAIVIFGIFEMANIDAGNACNYFVGYGSRNIELTAGNAIASILTEIILTFIFVYVILNVTDEKAGNAKIAGIVIGLTLTLVHLVGINLTGTSVNPARSIATAFSDLIYNDGGSEALKQLWIFIISPLAGGALSAVAYKFLHKEN